MYHSLLTLSLLTLFMCSGWIRLWDEDADRSGCRGGNQVSPRTRSPPQRHQTQERSGELLFTVIIGWALLRVSCN